VYLFSSFLSYLFNASRDESMNHAGDEVKPKYVQTLKHDEQGGEDPVPYPFRSKNRRRFDEYRVDDETRVYDETRDEEGDGEDGKQGVTYVLAPTALALL